jgi:hypothetical protein
MVLYLTSKNRGKKEVIKVLGEDYEGVSVLEKFVTQKGKWRHHTVKKLAKRALKYRHELFTFILVPGVEPTNNVAERALRSGVRQRKIWGCFRIKKDAENRDIMMSVMGTMKNQKKDFFRYGKEYILSKLS